MVQAISLGCNENIQWIKDPVGQKRIYCRVRAQLKYGGATYRRGDADQVAEAHGESDVVGDICGQGSSLDNRGRGGIRAVNHYRPFPEHKRCKELIVACRVLIVRRGGGSIVNFAAFLGKGRLGGSGGGMSK